MSDGVFVQRQTITKHEQLHRFVQCEARKTGIEAYNVEVLRSPPKRSGPHVVAMPNPRSLPSNFTMATWFRHTAAKSVMHEDMQITAINTNAMTSVITARTDSNDWS